MECDGGVSGSEVLDITGLYGDEMATQCYSGLKTHSDPIGHEIALVDDQNNLLMSFLFLDVFKDGVAKCSQRVPGVENM